jgi:hypothetical protein
MNRKYTLEYVKNYFIENNCLFLEDKYENARFSYNYKCSCGSLSKTNFNAFQNGRRCRKCGTKKTADKQRHDLQYVKNYFLSNGCEFLDNEYLNVDHPHNYICECKNVSKINFTSFQKGARCARCSGNEKFTLEYVKDYFLNNGCKFLDNEYVNNRFSHNYQCSCGNKNKINFYTFKKGARCARCSSNEKFTLKYVKDYFSSNRCEFLDDEYVGIHHPHKYKCSCGNFSKICFNNFQHGKRCMKCSGSEKFTLKYVNDYFTKNNCEFLDNEYINNQNKHNYVCVCGNKSKISFANFRKGRRCRKCAKNGFNSAKPSFVYLVGNHYRQKIGIMNENADRIKQHNKNFGLNLIDKIFFENGADAHELEQTILQKLKIKNIPHGRQVFTENFDGRTESWLLTDLEVTKIEELINL